MNYEIEQAYKRGSKAAWQQMLDQCIRELGGDSAEMRRVKLFSERQELLAKVRELCEMFGDNDWPDNLSLVDAIDKHLEQHLIDLICRAKSLFTRNMVVLPEKEAEQLAGEINAWLTETQDVE